MIFIFYVLQKQYFFSNVNYLEDLNSNVTKIIKNFLSRDVLLQYTAQRQKIGKLVFKDTAFYKLLEGILFKNYLKITKLF